MFCVVFTIFYVPFFYIFQYAMTPEGQNYVSLNRDEAIQISTMKSRTWEYKNPYDLDNDIFHDPILGSFYLSALLGLLPINMITMIVLKSVFFFLYLIVSFLLIEALTHSKKERKMAFIIFTLVYGSLSIFLFWHVGLNFTVPYYTTFGQFAVSSQIYYIIPIALAYFGLLSFTRGRMIFTNIMIALSIIFYPVFGAGIFATCFLYSILSKNRDYLKIFPSLLSAVFWIVPFLQIPGNFNSYLTYGDSLEFVEFINQNILVLPAAIFASFAIINKWKKHKLKDKFVCIWFVLFSVIILTNVLYPSRISMILVLPLSVLAAKPLSRVRESYIVAALLMTASVSGILNLSEQRLRSAQYIDSDHYNTLMKLKNLEYGNVAAGKDIDVFVPLLSDKRSMTGRPVESSETEKDFEILLNGSATERSYIVNKYNLSYLVTEKGIDVRKLHDGKLKIYDLRQL